MKLVCKYCGKDELINWGKKRKYCSLCKRTSSLQRPGRKGIKNRDMYLLDRSTYRRIGQKKKLSHVAIIKKVHKEIKYLPTPIDNLKKIVLKLQVFLSWMVSTLRLKELNIMSLWA